MGLFPIFPFLLKKQFSSFLPITLLLFSKKVTFDFLLPLTSLLTTLHALGYNFMLEQRVRVNFYVFEPQDFVASKFQIIVTSLMFIMLLLCSEHKKLEVYDLKGLEIEEYLKGSFWTWNYNLGMIQELSCLNFCRNQFYYIFGKLEFRNENKKC